MSPAGADQMKQNRYKVTCLLSPQFSIAIKLDAHVNPGLLDWAGKEGGRGT